MPEIMVNGARLYYVDEGTNHTDTIVFSHGFLFDHQMFETQVVYFQDRFRCVAYDHRGQGQSEITSSGYDIDSITDDAAALIEQLDLAPCHYVGLSMGGFAGLRLAIRHPALLKSLTLIESSAVPESTFKLMKYKLLALIARLFGTRPVVGQMMNIMFGKAFLKDPGRQQERERWRQHLASLNVTGVLRAMEGAVRRENIDELLQTIDTPTLIIVGDEDVALPVEKSQHMKELIPGAKLVVIPESGHSSSIETPDVINKVLENFWQSCCD